MKIVSPLNSPIFIKIYKKIGFVIYISKQVYQELDYDSKQIRTTIKITFESNTNTFIEHFNEAEKIGLNCGIQELLFDMKNVKYTSVLEEGGWVTYIEFINYYLPKHKI